MSAPDPQEAFRRGWLLTPDELRARALELWSAGLQPVYNTWKDYVNKDGDRVRQWSPQGGTTGGVDNAPWPETFPEPPHREPVTLNLRVPPSAWICDVDDHHGDGRGPATIAAAERDLGPLPATHKITSRPEDVSGPTGKCLFSIPDDLVIDSHMLKCFSSHPTPGVDSIRTGLRFARAPGQVHFKTGRAEVVYDPARQPCPLPHVRDWTPLPERWVAHFRSNTKLRTRARSGSGREHISSDDVLQALQDMRSGDPCERVAEAEAAAMAVCDPQGEGRYDAMVGCTMHLVGLGERGHIGVSEALTRVRVAYIDAVEADRDGGPEFSRMVDGAVQLVLADPTPAYRRGCDCSAGRKLVVTRASDIPMRAARWLWAEPPRGSKIDQILGDMSHWLSHGSFNLLGGRESTGKSTWAYKLSAQVTKGTLPGCFEGTPKSVVVVATEDSWSHTITPRLAAARADLGRVLRVDAIEGEITSGVTLPTDVAELRKLCEAEDVALVLLDPLMAAIAGELDSHKDHEVRRALEPLSRFAHDVGVCIVALIHVNKSVAGDMLTRLMGSRAFSATARSVLMTARERPETGAEAEVDRYLFGQAKNNLAARVRRTTVFEIHGAKVGRDDETGQDIWSSAVQVVGTRTGYIDDVIAEQETRSPGRETVTDRAVKWLRDQLAEGPVPSAKIKTEAEAAGYSLSTLHRARKLLELLSAPIDGTTATAWRLPEWEVEHTEQTEQTKHTEHTKQRADQQGSEEQPTPFIPFHVSHSPRRWNGTDGTDPGDGASSSDYIEEWI